MNLYHWTSPTLADWSDGDIITFGVDEEDARQRAIDAVMKEYAPDTGIDGYDYNESRREGLLRDLERAPKLVQEETVFITGGA